MQKNFKFDIMFIKKQPQYIDKKNIFQVFIDKKSK